ncbi:MAG: hypothetical protein LBS62_11860, partial [Clostridiales bacterium]|nr:hypothetical protein [Clostridiales bacterium]
MYISLNVTEPLISAYPSIANLLSVLGTEERCVPWICNHFNQLLYYQEEPDGKGAGTFIEHNVRELEYPHHEISFLRTSIVRYDQISRFWQSFVEFVKQHMEMGYYIQIPLNLRMIKRSGQTEDFMHPTMFFGFYEDTQQMAIADFYNNRRYRRYLVTLHEVEEAYRHSFKDYIYRDEALLFRFYHDEPYPQIDREQIRASLQDLLSSKDSSRKYLGSYRNRNRIFYYGLAFICQLIKDILARQADFRSIHVLCDFLKLWIWKLERIPVFPQAVSELSKQLTEAHRRSTLIRNKFIKYELVHGGQDGIPESRLVALAEECQWLQQEISNITCKILNESTARNKGVKDTS